MTPPTVVPVRKFVADAAERVGWTFLETFAGAAAIAAMTGKLSLPALYAAAIAGAAAALAMVKAFAASRLGKTGTASTLPAELDPANHPAPVIPPPIVNVYAPPATAEQAVAAAADGAVVNVFPTPANSDDAQADPGDLEAELAQPVDPAPPAPGTSSPPVEALAHVDPPEVPPAPTPTALGARAERDKAAAEVRATKAKTPAKKAAPAKRPARKAATPASSSTTKKAAAKKASSTRKRSR